MLREFSRMLAMRLQPGVHFLHIGKTGGTAIKEALTEFSSEKKIWLHGHAVTLQQIPKGQKFFFCLREPISRYVSGFCSRQRCGRPRRNVPWSVDEAKAFSWYQTPDALARSLSSRNLAERERAVFAMRSIGHVKGSFYDWVHSDNYFGSRLDDLLWLCFQEDLETDFTTLKDMLGIDPRARLPEDRVKAHRRPLEQEPSLSDLSRQNLTAWYESDIAFYDYCRRSRDHWCTG